MSDHKIEKKQKKKKKKLMDQALMEQLGVDKKELKRLKKKLIKSDNKPERGIETWFRLASKNLYTRLQIVDTKANILITANAIIISVVLGSLYPRLDEEFHLIFAVGGLLVTSVLSITFAILATIPKAWKSNTNIENLDSQDLMTFEDFSDMDIEDYKQSVIQIIENGNTLYSSMITDIHGLGIKLSRKYKMIRVSYLVFLYGIILSILGFAGCHFLSASH
jgi:hypothetical protein